MCDIVPTDFKCVLRTVKLPIYGAKLCIARRARTVTCAGEYVVRSNCEASIKKLTDIAPSPVGDAAVAQERISIAEIVLRIVHAVNKALFRSTHCDLLNNHPVEVCMHMQVEETRQHSHALNIQYLCTLRRWRHSDRIYALNQSVFINYVCVIAAITFGQIWYYSAI